MIVDALAEADAAEVEAQHRQTEGGEGLHGAVDGLIVQGSSAGWVRMADESGERRVVQAGVEHGFETAGGAKQIFDGADVRAKRTGNRGFRHNFRCTANTA
jgi:hypothetical protein